MLLVIILTFAATFFKAGSTLESLRVHSVLNRTQSCHSFCSPLYFFVLNREILFSYPWELHLFPIILRDGYLFTKYKSDVLGDKCTKDPSWWFEVNSLLCSLLPPYAFKLFIAHTSSNEITQWRRITPSVSCEKPSRILSNG